jgi:hypothetical protein
VIGHEMQLGWLARELPQVTLLVGPPSVGKRVLAEFVFSRYGGTDLAIEKLTAESARYAEEQSRISPMARAFKNIIIELDGSSEQVQNILLKTLEEPPATARFMLVASRYPLPTIVSRCAVIKCGLLTDEQVTEVLVLHGASPEEARQYAPHGCGTVAPALKSLQDSDNLKTTTSVVATALRTATERGGYLTAVMHNWSEEHTRLLYRWALEASSGRWHIFDASFAPGVSPEQARSLLAAMNYYSGSRLCARVSLDAVFGRS